MQSDNERHGFQNATIHAIHAISGNSHWFSAFPALWVSLAERRVPGEVGVWPPVDRMISRMIHEAWPKVITCEVDLGSSWTRHQTAIKSDASPQNTHFRRFTSVRMRACHCLWSEMFEGAKADARRIIEVQSCASRGNPEESTKKGPDLPLRYLVISRIC